MKSAKERDDVVQQRQWQKRLLPFMILAIVFGALAFTVMSTYELRAFYSRVEQNPFELTKIFDEFEKNEPSTRNIEYLRFKVSALLEANALDRRYHQATSTMLARVWTRQLGFLTGMLLALVGATFILGKLQESVTRLEAEAESLKGALESSSPGIVLAVLGTVLMGMTIWVPFGVETRDVNTYMTWPLKSLPPPNPLPPQLSPSNTKSANDRVLPLQPNGEGQ